MKSFIEEQFPVSKVSKESYKERKAVQSQTLTGLGKWWGRKPLILVRAAMLGSLLPATENPEKDMEMFLKLMGMDDSGLLLRKEKKFQVPFLYETIQKNKYLSAKYSSYFTEEDSTLKLTKDAPREEIESAVFLALGYDDRIGMCIRPEQMSNISEQSWKEINLYYDTSAKDIAGFISQISQKRFKHNVVVGDCFCGGGSIPFEAGRIGCNVFASDLNPIATLLTWADGSILCAKKADFDKHMDFQERLTSAVQLKIDELGIEINEKGDRAINYLFCTEVVCPECKTKVPVASSWMIGKGSKTIAFLEEKEGFFDIKIKMNATAQELRDAENNGTAKSNGVFCPHCRTITPISVLRHDRIEDGVNISGLKRWDKNKFVPDDDDVFQERLYAIRYEHEEVLPNGKIKSSRYYRAPTQIDLDNESRVLKLVKENFEKWQADGFVPSMEIEPGYNTDQVIRERGWKYWHQLFNARQLLYGALWIEMSLSIAKSSEEYAIATLMLNRLADWNSKLCRWGTGQARESMAQTYYNQALNTMWQYGTRGFEMLKNAMVIPIASLLDGMPANYSVEPVDARDVDTTCDLWITDPPYADAVYYHELSEFFLAWDRKLLTKAFPNWYTDSKRILAVRGDEHFSQTMIDIYSNLTRHMNDDGIQIVMFTHSDPAVWAQLALIMWKAGLTVTAAWNIATETDASGIKDGNYVKGTVLLVLRKQSGDSEAFLDELSVDIKNEVKYQIESMQKLDDKEEPNFSDPDYVLAAYAASLKVLTGYKAIGEIDLEYELNLAIHEPSKSEVVKLIERAKKIAYDFIIPTDFDNYLWKELLPAERFYIKGLESEMHGNYQISTYQEYSRGFGLSGYSQLMANEKANTARLKTPQEFAMRTIGDVAGFEESSLRLVLAAIYIAIKEDENPDKGLWHIKNNISDYWSNRDMLKMILSFLMSTEHIDNMPHWRDAAIMASHIYTLIVNDHI